MGCDLVYVVCSGRVSFCMSLDECFSVGVCMALRSSARHSKRVCGFCVNGNLSSCRLGPVSSGQLSAALGAGCEVRLSG